MATLPVHMKYQFKLYPFLYLYSTVILYWQSGDSFGMIWNRLSDPTSLKLQCTQRAGNVDHCSKWYRTHPDHLKRTLVTFKKLLYNNSKTIETTLSHSFPTFQRFFTAGAAVVSTITRGWQRGDRDPVSRTNFNKIHASRFESVIVGETSGKRNFHDQTQVIHESRIPHEINHVSHVFWYSRITFLFK